MGMGHAPLLQALQLFEQHRDVQGHAVADDVGDMAVKHAGRQSVQGKLAVVVDDGVAGVGAALEPDDDIRFRRQHVGDFAFALVAPVGAYDCFYHRYFPSFFSIPSIGSVCRCGLYQTKISAFMPSWSL